MGYAVKTARYPIVYERIKTPAAAGKALKDWEKAGEAPSLGCISPGLNQDVGRDDGDPDAIELNVTRGGTGGGTGSGKPTETNPSNGVLTPPSPPSSLAVTRRDTLASHLPP